MDYRRNNMNFIEYLKMLKEKYDVTNAEILSELQNNGIKITTSNLSHKLKGDRTFSKDELNVIVRVIRPTVAEIDKLFELYKIARFGKERFNEVMYIKKYVEDLADETIINFKSGIDSLDNISSIDNEKLLAETMYVMLKKSWNNDKIKIFCQPDFKQLVNQLILFNQNTTAYIEYLVCMNNDNKSDNNLYNINLLRSLGKIAKDNFNFNVKYFYDNINSRVNEFTFMPFFIICGEYTLFITHNFKSGFLSSDKNLNSMAENKFDSMFEISEKLFRIVPDITEYMKICTELELTCKEKFYTLQMHPCVLYSGDKSLADDHVKDSFPLKAALLNEVKVRTENINITGYNLHSKKGTDDFLHTGFTSDMSPLYSTPYSEAERKLILEKIKRCKNHIDVELKTDFISLPEEMVLCCYDNGNVVISYKSKLHECARLILNERGLYKSMLNFFEYLYNYEYKYYLDC